MANDFTSLYRARTGSAWASGAIGLALSATSHSISSYFVTGGYATLGSNWDMDANGTNYVENDPFYLGYDSLSNALNIPANIASSPYTYDTYYVSEDSFYFQGGSYYWLDVSQYPYGSDNNTELTFAFNDGGFNGSMDIVVGLSWFYGGCFIAGTKVSTPSGDVPIERIQVGDFVFSYDNKSNLVLPKKVEKVLHHAAQPRLYYTFNGRLTATEKHPLYVNGNWTHACKIKKGDKLTKLDGGYETVVSIANRKDSIPFYNLKVADTHNYYAEGILSHNKCPFLYSVTDGIEFMENTFIYEQNSKDKDIFQTRPLRSKTVAEKYIIKELEAENETSYVDMIALSVTDIFGKIHLLRCTNEKLRYFDGQYTVIETGQQLEIAFEQYTGDNILTIDVVAKGYYIPN